MTGTDAEVRILVVEDCADDAELMILGLEDAGFRITWSRVDTEPDFVAALGWSPDIILADYSVPSFSVSRALDRLAGSGRSIPLIVVSGTISEEVAVDCLTRGATDYLVKDRLARLPQAVARALERYRLRSQQDQAEAAVRMSEGRFRGAFDNAPIGMAITTSSGRLAEVNDSLCALLGLSRSELLGRTFLSVTNPDDHPQLQAFLRDVWERPTGFDAELRLLRGDGQLHWSRVSIAALDRTEGAPPQLIVQAQDIAARRRAEDHAREAARDAAEAIDALRRSEARFRSLAASAPVGVFQADAAGRYTYVNARWEDVTGVGPDAAAGDGWSATIHDDERATVVAAWREAVAGLQEYAGRFRVHAEPGGERWVDVRSVPLRDATDQVTGFVGTATDITLMVEAEAAIAAARDQALEASRLKSQFLANMSHEVRTPMNGVLGMAQLLLDTDLDETQQRYLGVLKESGENLLRIVNDILDFSKVEAGKLELERITFDVRTTVAGVVALHAVAAQRKGLALDLDIAPDVPRWLTGDPGRLHQILTNFTTNAIKFTDGGRVAVTVRGAPAARVRFEVTDTGIGIDQSAVRLLEPFSQADTSTTRRFGGTGLGLAICRQLVDLMGGRMGYSSEAGRGSTFWFEVPLPPGPAPAARPADPARDVPAGPYGDRARLLVAEDNPVNQLVAVRMLASLGYTADVAATGAEAIRAVQRASYAAVLMDCQMPDLDGFEATREIRRLQDGATRTPVIAITASATQDDRDRCIEAGMDDYVSKPVRVEELRGVLTRWVARAVPA